MILPVDSNAQGIDRKFFDKFGTNLTQTRRDSGCNQCRDKVKIVTKLPHYMLKSVEGAERLFREELKRLQTGHVDYYLMHMLSDMETWENLVRMGIPDWINGKLASGQIRNIGFSYHGETLMFQRLVDAYAWDFCQIQYNYMDENSQAGRAGLQYACAKGLPVIIMEPLRGGRLVELLPHTAKELFRTDPQGRTAAQMAFKWLYDQKEGRGYSWDFPLLQRHLF